MQIDSKVSWTQEELEHILRTELLVSAQEIIPQTVKVKMRRKKGDKAPPKSGAKTVQFNWTVRDGSVYVTANTRPAVRKVGIDDTNLVIGKAMSLLRIMLRAAHGEDVHLSELPPGVTMDALESIIMESTATASSPIEEEEEPEEPEETVDPMDLLHLSRKLLKNETRERP